MHIPPTSAPTKSADEADFLLVLIYSPHVNLLTPRSIIGVSILFYDLGVF